MFEDFDVHRAVSGATSLHAVVGGGSSSRSHRRFRSGCSRPPRSTTCAARSRGCRPHLRPSLPKRWPEYLRCFAEPTAIHASCEDYRAAATIDLDHDEVDVAAGRRIPHPLLVLWGARGFVGGHYDVADIWRRYATEVRANPLDCALAEPS